jgi:hypothetical protein
MEITSLGATDPLCQVKNADFVTLNHLTLGARREWQCLCLLHLYTIGAAPVIYYIYDIVCFQTFCLL